jgi:hypothetical protein
MPTPSRETFIALRACRTAVRLVSAFAAGRRPGLNAVTCRGCGRRFVPGPQDDPWAPRCQSCVVNLGYYVPPPPPRLRQSPHEFRRVRLPGFLMAKKS